MDEMMTTTNGMNADLPTANGVAHPPKRTAAKAVAAVKKRSPKTAKAKAKPSGKANAKGKKKARPKTAKAAPSTAKGESTAVKKVIEQLGAQSHVASAAFREAKAKLESHLRKEEETLAQRLGEIRAELAEVTGVPLASEKRSRRGLGNGQTYASRILQVLGQKPGLARGEIVRLVGGAKATASGALSALKTAGQVKSTGTPKLLRYYLPADLPKKGAPKAPKKARKK